MERFFLLGLLFLSVPVYAQNWRETYIYTDSDEKVTVYHSGEFKTSSATATTVKKRSALNPKDKVQKKNKNQDSLTL
jgi:hypothetical protein